MPCTKAIYRRYCVHLPLIHRPVVLDVPPMLSLCAYLRLMWIYTDLCTIENMVYRCSCGHARAVARRSSRVCDTSSLHVAMIGNNALLQDKMLSASVVTYKLCATR